MVGSLRVLFNWNRVFIRFFVFWIRMGDDEIEVIEIGRIFRKIIVRFY